MRARRPVAVAALVLLVAGCGPSAHTSASEKSSGADVARSAEQTKALSDGDVTYDEYQAAFRRYSSCLSAAGYELKDPVETNHAMDFSVPAAAVDSGVDGRCYSLEFELVDADWQAKNQDTSYTADVVRKCLQGHGVVPADSLDAMLTQLEKAGITFESCDG